MMKTIKCGICGYEFNYDDRKDVDPFVMPFNDGATYYYNLWHYDVEKCPECGFASKDIGKTYNKLITTDEKYQAISKLPLIIELNDARPNQIESYLKSAYYYESVGMTLDNIKCLLQAGDFVYAEMMYWEEYILDSSDDVNSIISNREYAELKKFADDLFNDALTKLEVYVKENPEDFDSLILLAGSLCDGDKIQNIKAAKILSNLKTLPLNIEQKKAVEFLINSID